MKIIFYPSLPDLESLKNEIDLSGNANTKEIEEEYHISIQTDNVAHLKEKFDAIILAVAHNEFKIMNLRDFGKPNCVVYDVKGVVDREQIDGRL